MEIWRATTKASGLVAMRERGRRLATTHDRIRPARKGAGNNRQTMSNLGTTDTTITNTTQAEAHGPVPSSLQQAAGKTTSSGTTHGTMLMHGIGTKDNWDSWNQQPEGGDTRQEPSSSSTQEIEHGGTKKTTRMR